MKIDNFQINISDFRLLLRSAKSFIYDLDSLSVQVAQKGNDRAKTIRGGYAFVDSQLFQLNNPLRSIVSFSITICDIEWTSEDLKRLVFRMLYAYSSDTKRSTGYPPTDKQQNIYIRQNFLKLLLPTLHALSKSNDYWMRMELEELYSRIQNKKRFLQLNTFEIQKI